MDLEWAPPQNEQVWRYLHADSKQPLSLKLLQMARPAWWRMGRPCLSVAPGCENGRVADEVGVGLGINGGGGAAERVRGSSGGMLEVVVVARGLGRGFCTAVEHEEAGWEGAPQISHDREALAENTLQYNSWSRAPQYVPTLNCCSLAAA